MAAELTIMPENPHVGETFVIAGTDFDTEADVTIAIREMGLTLKLTSDINGDFSSDDVADLVAMNGIPLNVTVSDGTTTKGVHVAIFEG